MTKRIYPVTQRHVAEAKTVTAANPPAAHEHLRVKSLDNLPNMPDLSKHEAVYCGEFPAFFDPITRAVLPKPKEMPVQGS